MTPLIRRLGWMLVGLSLLLHLFTIYCFSQQPDHLAAFTVIPIWMWGGAGLLLSVFAFYFLRAPLSLIVTGVWAVTLLVGSDEARVLANLGKPEPLPGRASYYQGSPVLRVITMNCATFKYGDPSQDIARWQPDIVLLQDTLSYQVRQIADALFDGHGDYRAHITNGIISRWKIQREVRNPTIRDQQVSITLPNGTYVEIVNIHLQSAATDLRFWRRATWTEHRVNRVNRCNELSMALQILENTAPRFPNSPTILGGDFNSTASDVVHHLLDRDFVDAFTNAGTGWGDTFHSRFPILRIDHIYSTRHFTPVRAKAVSTAHSDHRMVVVDYLLGKS